MTPPGRIVALLLALLTACAGGSGGGGGAAPGGSAASLRAFLDARGFAPLPAPPVVSDEAFALGQALFFDRILSGAQDVSCATCHLAHLASADGRALASGVGGIGVGPLRGGGAIVPRNTQSLLGVHLWNELFWDGRVDQRLVGPTGTVASPVDAHLTPAMRSVFTPGLERFAVQALVPPTVREEMRGFPGDSDLGDLADDAVPAVWDALLARLLAVPGYVALFQAAYPATPIGDLTFAHAANAIAGFEVRALARLDSPFERFLRGDDAALTQGEIDGASEFFAAGCARCHAGPFFSDQRHHDIGLPQIGPGKGDGPSGREDFGREGVTGDAGDRYDFRTPTLRGVALTAPYGHAGQFRTLRDFVSHYRDPEASHLAYDPAANVDDPALATSLVPNSAEVLARLDGRLRGRNGFDVDAVVTFLEALTPDDADLADVVPAGVPSGLPLDLPRLPAR